MYLDNIASTIRQQIAERHLPSTHSDELLLLYAVLLRAKGDTVTNSDVHDAWSAWMVKRDRNHPSLLPYDELNPEVQSEDQLFTTAIRTAAGHLRRTHPSQRTFLEVLFPSGLPQREPDKEQTLALYKVMVESSEKLVMRRQAVNTFFLTMNGALLTASGIIVQSHGSFRLGSLGILVIAVAGTILCGAWRSLITSFGQLNGGKFKVINTIERCLPAAIYSAEWEALERGTNPKVYRSFTSREIWVPTSLLVLHLLAALVALAIAVGAINLDMNIALTDPNDRAFTVDPV